MTEALVVFGLVGLLVVLGTLAIALTLEQLVLLAISCMLVGFVVGVAAGAYYHVLLYRALARRGPVPRGFIWSPTRYHGALQLDELRPILPWFRAGALGFMLIILGSVLLAFALLRA
ncbi:MAG: hypothetical protein RL701_4967 [Pseudomonadota bacterium]|jgi:hypothetical protein